MEMMWLVLLRSTSTRKNANDWVMLDLLLAELRWLNVKALL